MAQRPDIQDCNLIIREQPPNRRQYNLPTASQVAAIVVGGDEAGLISGRDIVVQCIGGRLFNIQDIVGFYDPLQYPLLLPYGTYGWDVNSHNEDGTNCTCRDFYAYILQIHSNDQSLFLRGGRLLQQYVVDNYVKIESHKLRWMHTHQKEIRAELYDGLQDSVHVGIRHADFLLRVGDGNEPTIDDEMMKVPASMVIPWENDRSIDKLIEEVFPNIESCAADSEYMVDRGLITPKNEAAENLNKRVNQKFFGRERVYYSFDKVENDPCNLYQQEFLNSISPRGLPPHELRLKEGAPIMLLRNHDPRNGLCNGTRLLCRALKSNFIDAEILTGAFKGFDFTISADSKDRHLLFKMDVLCDS
ncbi:hypothetical protein RHMOL_Rhmol10G0202000 [Rhododendron molle]|uniref:Uncharacterized protein n=1 Tax=Rhododendron molle TaxID=49168 RepID=A0ACC0M5J6_RHOML|nr:hypothetical protein RHMOL_Rhmol10G0202000 [Rhododendron molle]